MTSPIWRKTVLIFYMLILTCSTSVANEKLFHEARTLQREGKLDEAIEAYKTYLSRPSDSNSLSDQESAIYTEALVQLMNTFQSKGSPEECISALHEILSTSSLLKNKYPRDYYSVLGYALSRTERMKEAEETMLKALSLPLQNATPERYFRDYAYAAAVFYSNPKYQDDVINWCKEALVQAESCKNTSGQQWVTAMLGSIYKRNGNLTQALELFLQSKEEAQDRNDELGILNSLHRLTDIFLYWNIPVYANLYASEAIDVEKNRATTNPMVSAQSYINKGRALYQLGAIDSIPYYAAKAEKLCHSLPYNSGMVDVNLLNGIYMTEKGGDSLNSGIEELQRVTRQGTALNRARAYHRLAQTYLKYEKDQMAEIMLDSLYSLTNQESSPINIHIEYKPILNYYLKKKNLDKVNQYFKLMFNEDQLLQGRRVNQTLIDAIVDLQTGKKLQEIQIDELRQTNQRLWFLIFMTILLLTTSFLTVLLLNQKKQHKIQIRQADEKVAILLKKLNQRNSEKEMIGQEIKEFLKDKTNRQELETLSPFILKEDGESKFRECFELLHPIFLHRLREKVPSVTRREELLSMLIALKQDNKKIADLMAIAPRSVLMLRHRFRQKIGMSTEFSLENFIEEMLSE